MDRAVRCAGVVFFVISLLAASLPVAVVSAAEPVLTDSARSVVAGEIAGSLAGQQGSVAARDARVRSRTAFRGLSPAEARQALLARHPSLASQPGWLTFPSLSPLSDSRPLGPYVLSVDGGDGADSVVLTSEPVAFRNRAGDLRKIDLGLERDGDNLALRASPFDLALPDTLGQRILVGDGDRRFSVAPEVSNGASEAVVEQYAAFYGDVDPDTDFVVKPVLGGVETFSILRSPASPEELRLQFSGGAGSELRAMDGDDGFVLSQDGEDLAAISPPQAWDAQHRPVAVAASLEGDQLVMRVAHRGRDVAYPIVVDPTAIDTCTFFTTTGNGCQVDAWESSGDPTYNAGIAGWAFEGPADGRYAPYAGPGYLGNGLYIRNTALNYFWNGEAADWYYRAPRGVRIFQAEFRNLSQDNLPDNATCLFAGVLANTGAWELNSPRTYCAQQSLDQAWWWVPGSSVYYRGGGTDGNAAVFGAMANHTGWSSYFMDHMGAIAIGLQEMSYASNNPYVSSPDFPDNWQTDSNRYVTFHAGDAGLGIRRVEFSSPENPDWGPIDADTGTTANKTYSACTGGTRLACPKDVWVRVKLGRLREGYSTIRAKVTDVVGKTYTYEHAIAIQYYWASLQYGGSDQSINTPTEIAAFLNARSPSNNAATIRLWLGASPADQDRIAAFIEDDEWNPPGIDEDDPSVDGGEDTTDEALGDGGATTSVYTDSVQSADGSTVLEATTDSDRQAVASSLQPCPSNYVNRRDHRIFRLTRKVSLRVYLNPSVRDHVQINAKPQDIPWVESSIVTTIFTHPDTGRRIKNRVPRPSPGKPAYYSHSNSHAKPGTRFHYDSWVTFVGDGIVIGVYRLPNGTVAIRYLKATGFEGSCLA